MLILFQDNILIQDNRALLCDFGLSVLINDHKGLTSLNHGARQLVAPEVFTAMDTGEHFELNPAVDIYSLGCLIFEVCLRE